jgi:hypothetical protein
MDARAAGRHGWVLYGGRARELRVVFELDGHQLNPRFASIPIANTGVTRPLGFTSTTPIGRLNAASTMSRQIRSLIGPVTRRSAKTTLAAAAFLAAVLFVSTALGVSGAAAREHTLRPLCTNGSVSLTRHPGLLVFTVDCRREKRGKVGFVIGRGDGSGRHVTIRSFSPEPRVTGPGAVYRRGRCVRTRQQFACYAYADGRVRVRGLITVPVRTRCHSRIDLTQVVPCRGEAPGRPCLNLVTATIFDSEPKGC